MAETAQPSQPTPHHSPRREHPTHPLPTPRSPKVPRPAWSDRHPVWSGILCVLAAIAAFAVATFAWIIGEEGFGLMVGSMTVVFLCYVVGDWRKAFKMHQQKEN